MADRQGIARADLLVVALIIMIGATLLLGTVIRIREQAANLRCENNLKIISLSIENYASVHDRLPPLVDQGKGSATGHGLPSVFAMLIPYVEATSYRFDPDRSTDHYLAHSSVMFKYMDKDGTSYEEGGGMANQVWPIFIDPADRTASKLRDVPTTLPDGSTGYYATCSYAVNGQAHWGKKHYAEAINSFSTLILVSERPQVCVNSAGETIYNLWGVGFYSPHMPAFAALTPDDPPGLWSTGQIAPASLPEENAADRDALIRVRIGRQSAEPTPPDFPTPVQRVRPGQACDPRLPGTPHRRGLQAAMADGSVRIFAPDTSPWVFWSACMPARKAGEE